MNKPTPKVVHDDRNLAGAYGMAFVGLVLGIFGMHRYYLKQRIYGTVMSSASLVGLLLIFSVYASAYHQMLTGLLGGISGGGNANFSTIPDVSQIINDSLSSWQFYSGVALCVVGTVWFIVDFIRLPSLVRAYREGRVV